MIYGRLWTEEAIHVERITAGSLSGAQAPRQVGKVLYPLRKILLVVLRAATAGAHDFMEMKRGVEHRIGFLWRLDPFEAEISSHDTLTDEINAPLDHNPRAF